MALAVQLYEQAYQTMRQVLGADDRDTLAAAVNLGRAYYASGDRPMQANCSGTPSNGPSWYSGPAAR